MSLPVFCDYNQIPKAGWFMKNRGLLRSWLRGLKSKNMAAESVWLSAESCHGRWGYVTRQGRTALHDSVTLATAHQGFLFLHLLIRE